MASVLTLHLPHFPHHPIHIALFKDVTNAAHLRSQLLSANPAFDYAFLDATMILSADHLLLASVLALHAHLTARSKTRTPHSELVFRLHPNNNIGESYRKFGISHDSTHVVAVKFGLDPDITNESVSAHLGDEVKGESVSLDEQASELATWADVAKIRKTYKLNDVGKAKKGPAINGQAEDERKRIQSVILGTMTLKGS